MSKQGKLSAAKIFVGDLVPALGATLFTGRPTVRAGAFGFGCLEKLSGVLPEPISLAILTMDSWYELALFPAFLLRLYCLKPVEARS